MLVTIFPGPGDQFRVRELALGTIQANTVKWTGNYENAVEYVRENYDERNALAPGDFRAEVLARKRRSVET
jgi:hypothetical protein